MLANRTLMAASGASVTPYEATYVGSFVDSVNRTTYTSGSFSLPAGKIVVFVGGSGVSSTPTISSVSVDGNAASSVTTAVKNGEAILQIWEYDLASPVSGTVSVTFSANKGACSIQVYSIAAASGASASDTLSASASSNSTVSGTIDVPENGCVIGASSYQHSTNSTCTLTGVTEQVDEIAESGQHAHAGGFDNLSAADAGRTVQAVWTNTITSNLLQAVAYGP